MSARKAINHLKIDCTTSQNTQVLLKGAIMEACRMPILLSLLLMMVIYHASARTFSQPQFQQIIQKQMTKLWARDNVHKLQHRIQKRMAMPWGPPSGGGGGVIQPGPIIQPAPPITTCIVCDDQYGQYGDYYDDGGNY